MYVISKFKDYYDGVVGSVGLDKTIVYERETIDVDDDNKIPKEFKVIRSSWNHDNPFTNIARSRVDKKKTKKYDEVSTFVLGFCGKLYLGWEFTYQGFEDNDFQKRNPISKTEIIYGYDNVKDLIKFDYWRGSLDDDAKYIESFDPINIFREVNAPIFVFNGKGLILRNGQTFTINPNLKDFEFYKVIDAFTAFNEIEMFISGVLGTGENEMIEIDDKYKIMKRGFDYKWSFRKKSNKIK